MSTTLGKNLHLCFSLIKRPQHQVTNSPQHNLNNNNQYHSSSQPPTFTKNYNSLYEDLTYVPTTTSTYFSAPASPSSASDDTDMAEAEAPTTPDLTAIYASRRFFISSPGRSNSIVDSLSSWPEEENDHLRAVAGSVAVQTDSPDPYVDFRQSMQEMVDAREMASMEPKEAWEYLQELLLSYLSLNPNKNTHKYIVGAFADLVVTLMSPNNGASSSSLSSFSSCGGADIIGGM